MRPWQARKEKSQKIRKVKVEGRILYGRDGSSVPAHSRCEEYIIQYIDNDIMLTIIVIIIKVSAY